MSIDTDNLKAVLDLAFTLLEQKAPHEDPADRAALKAVNLMLERMQAVEERPDGMLSIAQDILSDYGYEATGIRHKGDHADAVHTVFNLSITHLSPAVFDWFNENPWIDTATVISDIDYPEGQRGYLISVPTSGAHLPDGMPRDLVAVMNVGLMRKVDRLCLTPDCPVYPGLPTFVLPKGDVDA